MLSFFKGCRCKSHYRLELDKGPGGSEEEALGDYGGGDDLNADPELFDKG